ILTCSHMPLSSLLTLLTVPALVFALLFFSTNPPTTQLYTLSLHDALPIFARICRLEHRHQEFTHLFGYLRLLPRLSAGFGQPPRSEEHTSELQSRENLVCRLLLEKKNYPKTQRGSRDTPVAAIHEYE